MLFSHYITFEDCYLEAGVVYIGSGVNQASHYTFRDIQLVADASLGSEEGAGMSYLTCNNITGVGSVLAKGVEHDGVVGYLANLSNINVAGCVWVMGYQEAYLDNVTCIYAIIDNIYTRINVLNTNNPDRYDPPGTGTGLSINPKKTIILTDYNAHDSLLLLTGDAVSNGVTLDSVAEFRYEPIIQMQKCRSNSNPNFKNALYFGSGTIDNNDTGGRTGGPCVSLNPSVAGGVGVTQRFNFVAPANHKRTITYFIEGINSFNGQVLEEVIFEGVPVVTSHIITITASYVKHTLTIPAEQIVVAGVLVLKFVASGSIGNVLIDGVTCA